jgi:hypothetical protein
MGLTCPRSAMSGTPMLAYSARGIATLYDELAI